MPASASATRNCAKDVRESKEYKSPTSDVFDADCAKPQRFRDEAWKAICQHVFTLAYGNEQKPSSLGTTQKQRRVHAERAGRIDKVAPLMGFLLRDRNRAFSTVQTFSYSKSGRHE